MSGGNEYSLAWALTGLEEPNWSTLEQRRQVKTLRPYARTADPVWVNAALAHFSDLDALTQKTANLRTGRKSFRGAEQGNQDEKPKGPRGGKKGAKGAEQEE
jgi:hypothetical protein